MSITFVSSQEDTFTGTADLSSRTLNVATGVRTHGILVVKINVINFTVTGDTTGVTWGGVALSKAVETSSVVPYADIWYLTEFGGGTQDVVVSWVGNGVDEGVNTAQIIVEWYDSDAAMEAGNTNTAENGTDDPASITVDTTAAGELVTGCYVTADNNLPSATAGTLTQDYDQGGNCTGGSYLIAGAAGTQTLTWDRNATGLSAPFNQAVAAFREISAAGGTPPPGKLQAMGIIF